MSKAIGPFLRRQVVGVLGAGGLAVVIQRPAFPQASSTPQPVQIMQDPVSKYPKPPFKRQSQAWPGLASKMEPKPDHGETSYKGNGRLAGRRALITGGDSGMGRAAAIAYAREGADVAINYHPDEEPDAQEVIKLIKDAGRNGVALPGDLREEAFCTKLVTDAVQKLGGLDILVSNAGRQQAHDSILDISTEQFDWTMPFEPARHHIGGKQHAAARPSIFADRKARCLQQRLPRGLREGTVVAWRSI
jgi:hypothetical protein